MGDAEVTLRLDLEADSAAVREAHEWAKSLTANIGLSDEDIYRLDLCVCEIVTNLVSYAFGGEKGRRFQLSADTAPGVVRIAVSDDGRPFNPLSHAPPTAPSSLAEAPIGGLGIDLVREFSDECSYAREAGRNVFTFVIRRRDPAVPARAARGMERRRYSAPIIFPLVRADGTAVENEERAGIDRRVLGAVSAFKMFRGVPYSAMEEIVAGYPTRSFDKAEILLRPGDRNEYVALVIRGCLKVHLDSPDSAEFVEIGVGECVGEMSVIDGEPISAFVRAEPGCELLLIDPENFLSKVLAIPGVARNLLMMLSERMRLTNRQAVGNVKSALELENLQRELRNAHEIQASMVPERHVLTTDDLAVQCSGYMHAAREVGGDFYDAFMVGPDRIFIAIGDVCGKGMAAALFMARTMALLRSEASHSAMSKRRHTQDIIACVNRMLAANNAAGLFVSIFCGVLDIPSGKFSFVNAGHTPPLILAPGLPARFLPGPRNPVAGVLEDFKFKLGEIKLEPGNALLLYTDGVTEAENIAGEMFGDHRLLDFWPADQVGSANAITDALVAAVNDFAGGHPQSDDITMLALVLAS